MKNLSKLFLSTLLSLALFAPLVAQAAEYKPMLTLTCASFDQCMSTTKTLADLGGARDQHSGVQMMVRQLDGFDTKRPCGIFLFSNGESVSPVVFLPIKNLDKFAESGLVAPIFDRANRVKAGKYRIGTPYGDFLFEQKGDWSYVYPEDMGKLVPADPIALMTEKDKKNAISLYWDFTNTPEDEVLSFCDTLALLIQMTGDMGQVAAFDTMIERLEVLMAEAKNMYCGLVKNSDGALEVDFQIEGKPGRTLSRMIQNASQDKCDFAGFYNTGEAFSFKQGIKIGPEQRSAIENGINSFFDGAIIQMEDSGLDLMIVDTIAEFFDSFREIGNSMFDGRQMNMGGTLFNNGDVVFGSAGAGDKVKATLNKLIRLGYQYAPDYAADIVKKDFETVEGYSLTRLTLALDNIPSSYLPEGLDGKTFYVVVGSKDDAFCLSWGLTPQAEERLKKAIKASKAAGDKAAASVAGTPARLADMYNIVLDTLELDDPSPVIYDVVSMMEKASPSGKFAVDNTWEKGVHSTKIVANDSVVMVLVDLFREFALPLLK
ncbi:MAG: hypothetical protein ACRC10_00380 [Thermoguttaceae bacterium]